MSTDKRIDYVEFPAADFDQFEAFYREVFDWTFTDYGPDYRAFSDGHLDGGIYRSELKSSTSTGAALVILYADDLESTQDRIVAHGGQHAAGTSNINR